MHSQNFKLTPPAYVRIKRFHEISIQTNQMVAHSKIVLKPQKKPTDGMTNVVTTSVHLYAK
jgi:hypothetical protein